MKRLSIFIGLLLCVSCMAENSLAATTSSKHHKHHHRKKAVERVAEPAPPEEKKKSNEPDGGTVWIEPKTGMEFVWAPSGCFEMGTSSGSEIEQPAHEVCVKGFWIGRYEVTQAQYQKVTDSTPSHFQGRDRPVEQVSWNDAKSFADKMSSSTGTNVSLPSEAQWEYACRAGSADDIYCGSVKQAGQAAWYNDNSKEQTHPVGQLAANAWGVFDMNGNVWEWTLDCWNDSYQGSPPTDGSAWTSGDCSKHVLRGGSWDSLLLFLNATVRYNMDSDSRDFFSGFRLVRLPQPPAAPIPAKQ